MLTQYLLAGAATMAYALMCHYCLRNRVSADPVESRDSMASGSGRKPVLIAFASQSGTAESLAKKQADALRSVHEVIVRPLNAVTDSILMMCDTALFIVSTFGEGEPPDNAIRFRRQWRQRAQGTQLAALNYAVLALGDRRYRQFCAFGRELHDMLAGQGAQAMFTPVCVDAQDATGLQQWREQLQSRVQVDDLPCLATSSTHQEFEPWVLHNRVCLNAGSPGHPVFHLSLASQASSTATWQAGDIAEIVVADNGTEQRREYSIASLPTNGNLELVVRQLVKDDGSLGVGSGWLTESVAINSTIMLRVRRNPGFHAPGTTTREARRVPMILIGNGTGIAGLRAHLLAREQCQAHRNWLIFGERSKACDFHFASQLLDWKEQQHLQRLDLAFSRDPDCGAYVQHRLRDEADTLRQWITHGAAIYVCGSRAGMAEDVHQALTDILGHTAVDDLLESGRYRRDIY